MKFCIEKTWKTVKIEGGKVGADCRQVVEEDDKSCREVRNFFIHVVI